MICFIRVNSNTRETAEVLSSVKKMESMFCEEL